MISQHILERLKEIKLQALARYSNFHVAALLITKDGAEYSGFNIESSSYGLTICAERVAMFKALSEGEREFNQIYVMADGNSPCPPCGACRQVLHDYAPDILVTMLDENGTALEKKLAELLPHAFTVDRLGG